MATGEAESGTGKAGAPLAVVTGSTRGIGFGIAVRLLDAGYRLVLHGRDQGRVDAAERARRSSENGEVVGGVAADLSGASAAEEFTRQVERRFGSPDALVLNAGGSRIPPGPVQDIAVDDWELAIRDNLTSAFLVLKGFLPGMTSRGSGAVVAISSSVTRRAHERSPAAYTAAKAGLEALIRVVAVQAGPSGVRANCVVPETIMTEGNEQAIPQEIRPQLVASHPIRRLGSVDDVAAAVAFLLSPAASWITGESVAVTGGA